jgi:hypothetical protein
MEVKLHVCGDSRFENVNSLWWFVLCWLYKPYWCCCCLLLALSVGPHLSRFHQKTETQSSIRNVVFK